MIIQFFFLRVYLPCVNHTSEYSLDRQFLSASRLTSHYAKSRWQLITYMKKRHVRALPNQCKAALCTTKVYVSTTILGVTPTSQKSRSSLYTMVHNVGQWCRAKSLVSFFGQHWSLSCSLGIAKFHPTSPHFLIDLNYAQFQPPSCTSCQLHLSYFVDVECSWQDTQKSGQIGLMLSIWKLS